MIWWPYPAIRAMSSCTHHYYSEGPVQRNSHMKLLVYGDNGLLFHQETLRYMIHCQHPACRKDMSSWLHSNVRVVMRIGGFSQDQWILGWLACVC